MSSSLLEARRETAFLAKRLMGRAGDCGVSSDALIAYSAVGQPVPDDIYPHDLGDYGRCCEAFALAPYVLREHMLPQIVAWGERLLAERTGE